MGEKKLSILLFLIFCLAALSGCVFDSVDSMYALPKSSEAYLNLQAKIQDEKGSAEYISPLSGDNRQTIQLVDIDGDGRQEAVAFFREPSAEMPLKIVLFRQDDQGEYQVLAHIEGAGSEIESIAYLDLTGTGGRDILVSWQVSASVHTLAAYSLDSGTPVEIMHSVYDRYLTAELDGDPALELVLSQRDGTHPNHLRVEYYDSREGILSLRFAVPLSEGASDISSWSAGRLDDGRPALFVTSYFPQDMLITDVFCVSSEGLKNIALPPNGRASESTFHYYAGVTPADMNGDGITEVPVAVAVPSCGAASGQDFWWLHWVQYHADGTRSKVLTTYHGSDGWYLELPESWTGEFAMKRQESANTGVRSVTFCRLNTDGETGEYQDFLTISSLVGADRLSLSQRNNRFRLYADSSTIYTGEFLPCSWDCGLDESQLIARFHPPRATLWDYPED